MEGGWNFSFNVYVKKMRYALVKRKRKVNPFKMIIDEYLNNKDYYFSRGRGISVYNADELFFDS